MRARERLTDRQSTARPDYHKGGRRKKGEEKGREGDERVRCGEGADKKEMAISECMAAVEVEIRDPWVLGEMTDGRPSARDHTLTLALELLISVSFGEHLRAMSIVISLFTKGYSGCGMASGDRGDVHISRATVNWSVQQIYHLFIQSLELNKHI